MTQLEGSLCISFSTAGLCSTACFKAFLCSKDVDSLLVSFNMVTFLRRKKLLFVKMRTSSIKNSYKSQFIIQLNWLDRPGP